MTEKTILITGASSGLGRALAIQYSEPYTTLLLSGRNEQRLAEVCEKCVERGAKVVAKVVDVCDYAQMASWIEAVDKSHPIDLVIANAGVTAGTGFGRPRETVEAASRVISTNILGVMNTILPALTLMVPRASGQLAIIASLAGYRGLPYSPSYCASKAALLVYAEGLRANLRGTGIGVSVVSPGFVSTSMNKNSIFPKPFEMSAERAATIIRRGLDRRAKKIVFPKLLYFGIRSLSLFPSGLVDRIMSRVEVDIPEGA